MKNLYQFLMILSVCVLYGGVLGAQPTCDNPTVIIEDDFESYDLGALGPQADHWTTWSGSSDEEGTVVSNASASGTQSIFFQGVAGGGPQDVVLLLGDRDTGMYLLNWSMLVADGANAYFNLQRTTTPGQEFAAEILFDVSGLGALFVADEQFLFEYPQGEWFEVRLTLDTDNDVATLFIAGSFVYSWPLSWTVETMTGSGSAFGSVDFYPIDESSFFWVDDIYFAEIPPAAPGKYCYMAIPIDTAGVYTVDEVSCFGAGFTVRSAGQGLAGMWYEWTAPDDGILTLASCNGGGDTRVWIFSGGCTSLDLEGVNDDRCEMTPGSSEYASYRQVLVSAGETYLICWDDIWEDTGFEFELSFDTNEPEAGDFCQTAIPVAANDTITIDQINGDAAVSGPVIGHFGSSTTPYAQSEWYSFTPDQNGMMTVSSCDLTTEDTRLWIYTGECGFGSLELVAFNDDSCDLQSFVAMQVQAGTTYYIEWDNENVDAPGFDWTLQFDPEVNTTEQELFEQAFRLSPNPVTDVTLLSFELEEPTVLQVRMMDMNGQEVYRSSTAEVQQGSMELRVSDLPKGIYIVSVTDGQSVMNQKLIVQ